MGRWHRTAVLFCAAAGWAVAVPADAATYRYTDLGQVGLDSQALGINGIGQVVGSTRTGFLVDTAAIWNGTAMTLLQTPAASSTYAMAINDAGQIVGYSQQMFRYTERALVWNGTTSTSLDQAGNVSSIATDINNAGQIVGYLGNGGSTRAAVWNGGTPTVLDTSPYSAARGINSAGQVVGGRDQIVGGPPTPVLWNGATSTVLGGGDAAAINDGGQIVGSRSDTSTGGRTALLWSGNAETVLQPLDPMGNGVARSVNNAGQIVGRSWRSGDSSANAHAVLWNGAVATDLNSFLDESTVAAGWYLYEAADINDQGWIVGTAVRNVDGRFESHAYLLSVVPEPGRAVLLLVGLAALRLRSGRMKT